MAEEQQSPEEQSQEEPQSAPVFQLQEVVDQEAASSPSAEDTTDWKAQAELAEKRRRDTEAEYTRQQQRLNSLEDRVVQLTNQLSQPAAAAPAAQSDPLSDLEDDDFLTAGQVRAALNQTASTIANQVASVLDSRLAPMADMVVASSSDDLLEPIKGSPLEGEFRRRYDEQLRALPFDARMNRAMQEVIRNSVVGQMRVEGADPLSHRSKAAGNGGRDIPAGPDSSSAPSPARRQTSHDPLVFESDDDYGRAGKLAAARRDFGLGSGNLQTDWNKMRAESAQ